jgi:predicted ArsR family transcriptional regulator
MKTSRQRLLEYIRNQRAVTAGDLAAALRMTEANARHHLAILQERGLVQVIGERPAKGKGRPAQLFGLSQHNLGDNLPALVSALLDELLERDGTEARQELLRGAARRMIQKHPAAGKPPSNLSARLVETVQRLQELHYQARWEARSGAPRLILGHCPYHAILSEHPELCQADASLLEGLLGAPVEQRAKLASDGKGLTQCIFQVGAAQSLSVSNAAGKIIQ